MTRRKLELTGIPMPQGVPKRRRKKLPRILRCGNKSLFLESKPKKKPTFANEEVRVLLGNASERTQLYLLLMASCGFTQIDRSELRTERDTGACGNSHGAWIHGTLDSQASSGSVYAPSSPITVTVPEPTALALSGSALLRLGMAFLWRRRGVGSGPYSAFKFKGTNRGGAFDYGNIEGFASGSCSNLAHTIDSVAYDNSGAAIQTGAVPEPSTLTLLAAMAGGAVALREWKRRRELPAVKAPE
jgi:hypothetical protein